MTLPTAISVQVVNQREECLYTSNTRHPILHRMMTPYYIILDVLLPSTIMVVAYTKMGFTLYRSEFTSNDKKTAQSNLFQVYSYVVMSDTI